MVALGAAARRRELTALPTDVINQYAIDEVIEEHEKNPARRKEEREQKRKVIQHINGVAAAQDRVCYHGHPTWLPDMKTSWQAKVFTILDQPSSCKLGKVIGAIFLAIIIMSTLAFVISTLPRYRDKYGARNAGGDFALLENFTLWMFTLEYLTRLATVIFVPTEYIRLEGYNIPRIRRSRFCLNVGVLQSITKIIFFTCDLMNLVDLLSCLPLILNIFLDNKSEYTIAKVLRLTRGLRLVRIGRLREDFWWFKSTMSRSRVILSVVFFVITAMTLVFSVAIWWAESGDFNEEKGYYERVDLFGSGKERTPFTSISTSLWWVVCTATGVGYGDMYPTTDEGRFVGIVCMYFGLLGLALPVAAISVHLGETKRSIDEENRMLLLHSMPWHEKWSPQELLQSANEMLEITDELMKISKSMNFWAGHANSTDKSKLMDSKTRNYLRRKSSMANTVGISMTPRPQKLSPHEDCRKGRSRNRSTSNPKLRTAEIDSSTNLLSNKQRYQSTEPKDVLDVTIHYENPRDGGMVGTDGKLPRARPKTAFGSFKESSNMLDQFNNTGIKAEDIHLSFDFAQDEEKEKPKDTKNKGQDGDENPIPSGQPRTSSVQTDEMKLEDVDDAIGLDDIHFGSSRIKGNALELEDIKLGEDFEVKPKTDLVEDNFVSMKRAFREPKNEKTDMERARSTSDPSVVKPRVASENKHARSREPSAYKQEIIFMRNSMDALDVSRNLAGFPISEGTQKESKPFMPTVGDMNWFHPSRIKKMKDSMLRHQSVPVKEMKARRKDLKLRRKKSKKNRGSPSMLDECVDDAKRAIEGRGNSRRFSRFEIKMLKDDDRNLRTAMKLLILGDTARKADSMMRMLEQSSLLLSFSDIILTRANATLVSRIFGEEHEVRQCNFSSKICCWCRKRKTANGDEKYKGEDGEEEEDLGWDYDPCVQNMRLTLISTRVEATLSTRTAMGLRERAQAAGYYSGT
ncbi:hypothetical protein AAMO2058_000204000 [Amorphochlora amoebiformis]